jgi:hypothetical protein
MIGFKLAPKTGTGQSTVFVPDYHLAPYNGRRSGHRHRHRDLHLEQTLDAEDWHADDLDVLFRA